MVIPAVETSGSATGVLEAPVRSSSFPLNRIDLNPGNDQAHFVHMSRCQSMRT
jgi:hypothetical protein